MVMEPQQLLLSFSLSTSQRPRKDSGSAPRASPRAGGRRLTMTDDKKVCHYRYVYYPVGTFSIL